MPVNPSCKAIATRIYASGPLTAMSNAPLVCGPFGPVVLTATLCSGQRSPLVTVIGRPNLFRTRCRRSIDDIGMFMRPQCLQANSFRVKFCVNCMSTSLGWDCQRHGLHFYV